MSKSVGGKDDELLELESRKMMVARGTKKWGSKKEVEKLPTERKATLRLVFADLVAANYKRSTRRTLILGNSHRQTHDKG